MSEDSVLTEIFLERITEAIFSVYEHSVLWKNAKVFRYDEYCLAREAARKVYHLL